MTFDLSRQVGGVDTGVGTVTKVCSLGAKNGSSGEDLRGFISIKVSLSLM